jgi:hypothetical protein
MIDCLYGLYAGDEHLNSCTECGARFRKLAAVRAEVVRPPEIPFELLAEQRRRIHSRLEKPFFTWHPLRWAGAAAAISALALGLLLHHPKAPAARDDQFFSEITTLDQNPAPRAVQPIEALVGDEAQE